MSGEPVGLVADLWRYPVKSFGGEQVRRAFLGPFGLLGDRAHAVLDTDGRPLSARRAKALLGYRARSVDTPDGPGVEVRTPEGALLRPDEPALAAALSHDLGRPVSLVRSAIGLHDAAPIHLVTTTSVATVAGWVGDDLDRRRFRANLIVETDAGEPFAEADWPGSLLTVGDEGALLEVVSPTERCAVTTFDPDTLARDNRVLTVLARERDNLFGVYARVRRPGWVAVGSEARLGSAGVDVSDGLGTISSTTRGGAVR